jgi:hypothetical protein
MWEYEIRDILIMLVVNYVINHVLITPYTMSKEGRVRGSNMTSLGSVPLENVVFDCGPIDPRVWIELDQL